MKHEIDTFDAEPPTNLDAFVGMVRKTSDEQHLAMIQAFSIRVPMTIACMFDAMAEYSGKSRNKLIVKAMEVALDHLWQELPEAERGPLDELYRRHLKQAMSGNDSESGEV
jgi:hypothetical protein